MSDAILQILLLLGYLAIGLISITFPIYAICVTYFRQEKSETEKERKQRIIQLKETVSKLTTELSGETEDSDRFRQIKERIEKHKTELEGLELRVRHLSAKGAVGEPVISLALALLAVGVGINSFYQEELLTVYVFGAISAGLSALSIYNLYKTILAVEHASLRPARTIEFDICYDTYVDHCEIKVGKETDLRIGACPEETVENFQLIIMIPREIETKVLSKDASTSLQPQVSHFSTAIIMRKDWAPADVYQGVHTVVKANRKGTYRILVRLFGKGIYPYEGELTLKVE